MADPRSFRQEMYERSPSWLPRFFGSRVLYAIAIHFDALATMMRKAVLLRFPNVYSNETLPLLSRERQTIRGKYATDAEHAEHLAQALPMHAEKGGPYELLAEVWLHYKPNNFQVDLLYPSGAHFLQNPTTGTVTRDAIAFQTGFPSAQWARWFLVYQWPTAIDDDGLWDDGDPDWDDGGVWDYDIADLSAADVDDLRLVPTAWNTAHAKGQVILVPPGTQLWDLPDGTWDENDDDWDSPGGEPCTIEIR